MAYIYGGPFILTYTKGLLQISYAPGLIIGQNRVTPALLEARSHR